jgi:dTDP-4-dehydrorhamnose reductase
MRIGVFGAGGRLGRHLAEILRSAGHEVSAWTRPDADIERAEEVFRVVRAARPEAVVNAASLTDVDRCEAEPAAAWRANALGVAHVAEAAAEVGARFVHISTDYVFDGAREAGAYAEGDAVGPLGMYARSKVAGEEAAILVAPGATILRVAWIFGGGGHRPDFVTWALARARRGEPVPALRDQVGCPTYTAEIGALLAARIGDLPSGVVHVVGPEPTTRLEMAQHIIDRAGLRTDLRPVSWADLRAAAPRPRRLVLSIDRARAIGYAPRPWRAAVDDYLARLAA